MAFSLPPSIRADLIELRRGGLPSIAVSLSTPALIVLGCAGLGSVSLYTGAAWSALASAALAIVGSYTVIHGRVSDARLRARTGWCGALPADRGVVVRACLALTGAGLLTAICIAALLLGIVSIWVSQPTGLASALIVTDGGLVVGAAAALLHLMVFRDRQPGVHGESIREPLFGLAWLDSRAIPHVMDWQRRATLIPWRRGAAAVVILPILRLGPGTASMTRVVAPALLLGSIVWFALVMRESARVAGSASKLLASMPITAKRWRAAALRYPLIGATCATAAAIIGALLAHNQTFSLGVWFACAIAAAIGPVIRIVRRPRVGTHP